MNEGRKEIIQIAFIAVAVIFLIKLFFIQVVDRRYEELANSNAILRQIDPPVRGLIYDRNGKLLVYNTPEFDLEIIRKEVHNFDSAKFCDVFGLTMPELRQKFKELRARREYSPIKPTVFLRQLSNRDFARIQDRIDEFKGFYIKPRSTRAYTTTALANQLGYVSEISREQLRRDTARIYRQGDEIGESGIEAFYEPYLRGKGGVRYFLRNVNGIIKGPFNEGRNDTLSVPGQDLVSTIDIDLQEYGEYLMNGKAGSIIAIDPATGEILAMVSGPSYDPNMLTGRHYSENFKLISSDTNIPLFN